MALNDFEYKYFDADDEQLLDGLSVYGNGPWIFEDDRKFLDDCDVDDLARVRGMHALSVFVQSTLERDMAEVQSIDVRFGHEGNEYQAQMPVNEVLDFMKQEVPGVGKGRKFEEFLYPRDRRAVHEVEDMLRQTRPSSPGGTDCTAG